MIYIGIDNGVSGSIGIIDTTTNLVSYHHMPVKKELSYTKAAQWINRVDIKEFSKILEDKDNTSTKIVMERPLVNFTMFKATMSAIRCLEATLICLERYQLSFSYLDSKVWQKALLPSGLKGKDLKIASLQIGQRLYPQIDFKGFTDADGLLLAHWLHTIQR